MQASPNVAFVVLLSKAEQNGMRVSKGAYILTGPSVPSKYSTSTNVLTGHYS